jgi:hypothetical protein
MDGSATRVFMRPFADEGRVGSAYRAPIYPGVEECLASQAGGPSALSLPIVHQSESVGRDMSPWPFVLGPERVPDRPCP